MQQLNVFNLDWWSLLKGGFLGFGLVVMVWLCLPARGKVNADGVNIMVTNQSESAIWFPPDDEPVLAPPTPLTVTVSISHTQPVQAGFPAYFEIITRTSGTLNIFPTNYTWNFSDGTPAINLTKTQVISHTFSRVKVYPISLIATFKEDLPPITLFENLNVIEPHKQYLPLIFKGFIPPETDLTCQLKVTPQAPTTDEPIQLTILITSTHAISESFWVDLYINPTEAITFNVPWGENCAGTGVEDTAHCLGIAWEVDATKLKPNVPFELISVPKNFLPGGFDEEHTNWPGILPVGIYTVTALADSINHDTNYGALNEVDETNNICASPALRFTVSPKTNFRNTEENIKPAPQRRR